MAQLKLADRIVADREILGGKPVIAGSRLSVEFVVGQLGRGLPIDELVREYGVSKEDVLAALRFAANSVGRDIVVPGGV